MQDTYTCTVNKKTTTCTITSTAINTMATATTTTNSKLPEANLLGVIVVQFYLWLKFSFPLFQTHYHTVHYHTQKQRNWILALFVWCNIQIVFTELTQNKQWSIISVAALTKNGLLQVVVVLSVYLFWCFCILCFNFSFGWMTWKL